MADLQTTPSCPDNHLASPSPRTPRSDQCTLIIVPCLAYAIPTILGLLMIIFLVIPGLMSPEVELNQASSLSSLNSSTSLVGVLWDITLSLKNPSKLFPVEYAHMKLQLSFDGRLHLSDPSIIPTFTQGPGNVTTVRAEAMANLTMINDSDVKDLAGALNHTVVTIDVVVKARRKLHLRLWRVPMFDFYASCMDATFTPPTDSKGGGNRMILGCNLSCTLGIVTLLW